VAGERRKDWEKKKKRKKREKGKDGPKGFVQLPSFDSEKKEFQKGRKTNRFRFFPLNNFNPRPGREEKGGGKKKNCEEKKREKQGVSSHLPLYSSVDATVGWERRKNSKKKKRRETSPSLSLPFLPYSLRGPPPDGREGEKKRGRKGGSKPPDRVPFSPNTMGRPAERGGGGKKGRRKKKKGSRTRDEAAR